MSPTIDHGAIVAELWRAVWTLLTSEWPDAEGRLAHLPHAGKVARLEASAARRGARVLRGELALPEFVARLREFSQAAHDALARQERAHAAEPSHERIRHGHDRHA